MKRLVLSLVASTLLAFLGCSPARDTGGGSGGNLASGGQSGSNNSGGSSGSGGTSSSSGGSGSGGESSSGGNQGSGGSNNSGGSQGSGGSNNSGGSQGSGGSSSGNGGAGGAGTNACNASAGSDAVAFCNGQALGVLTGWAWVALGSADSITDPTCDAGKAAITNKTSCPANTNWNQASALCMSGKIPALSTTDAAPDYAGNWGVQIGVNAKDPNAAMGGSGYKTITFTVNGSPSSGLRALVHRAGDVPDTSYCAPMISSGAALDLTTFNTKCWDSTGDNLAAADVPNIDQVAVQVTSTTSEITVDNLCLTKVEFGN